MDYQVEKVANGYIITRKDDQKQFVALTKDYIANGIVDDLMKIGEYAEKDGITEFSLSISRVN